MTAIQQPAGTADWPWLASYPERIAWDRAFAARPLGELLAEAAARHPDRPALDFMGRKWRYATLASEAKAIAAGLQQLGVKKGTRVGLMLPNSPYYILYYYATLIAGGIVVNFNPLYATREIERQIADAEPEIMVTLDLGALQDKVLTAAAGATVRRIVICPFAGALPALKSLGFRLLKRREIARFPADARCVHHNAVLGEAAVPEPVEIDPYEDVAVLQYTGGTTGTSKGAMLTHANLWINTEQAVAWFEGAQDGEERMMAVIPFFHVFAMTVVMNFGIRLAAEIIALPRFELNDLLKTIHRTRPTLFPAVPTIYTAINHAPDLARYDLTSINACLSGGAALPIDVKESFERLTGCRLLEGYGLTESSPIATCQPLMGENRPGSIGLPVPATVVEIIDMQDGVTPVAPGERGEVCLSGPQVMKGYWNRPEETANALKGGRLHTGDVGIMDHDGYVRIVDRIKDIIIAGGYNLYPRTIEEAIYQHPAVEECIVGGVPDAYRGETVKAWIKLKAGEQLPTAELKAFLKDKLSPIEIPKQIEYRTDPLPKTMIGKLSRKAVVEEHLNGHKEQS